jgi:hypothetical protein
MRARAAAADTANWGTGVQGSPRVSGALGAVTNSKQALLACSALVGVSLLVPQIAEAQSMSDSEKIQLLERQTELLQKQLKEIKDEIARSRKKSEQSEARRKSDEADTGQIEARRNSEEVDTVSAAIPVAPARPVVQTKAPLLPEGVKVTLGGFLAAETVFRQRNGAGSSFTGIPYPFSPLYNENEFHASARQSRISLLAEGNLDPLQKLSGYYEMDFLGVGQSSNFTQSNSWAPRLRQAYVDYDNKGWGFHVLGGQAWSLLTQTTTGITPRKENIPLTIDASYVVGFNYTRNWQMRLVEEFGPAFSAGISVEAPATIVGGSAATGPLGLGFSTPFTSGGQVVNGLLVNFSNVGSGGFLNGVAVTTDTVPDVIGKLAFDPGWGHYEVFGIQRFFSDNVLNCFPVSCTTGSITITGATSKKTTYGEGVGGSVLLPVIQKYVDFTGNVMYGRGIGRYGAGNLPDVTIASDGSLSPLTELTAMVGLIGHPWEGLDVYGYAGIEQVNANFFNVPGTGPFGFGNPAFSSAGCTTTSGLSFSTGAAPVNCAANNNNRRLSDVTVGFWQNIYKGQYGRFAVGAQYEYIKRESFDGVGGPVATADNVIFTSLRYYPF